MKLCIDDANTEAIRRICDYYPIDGVSTNPTILSKTGRNPYEVLKEIRSIIGEEGELFVQAVSPDAEGIVREAHRIVSELGARTLVKIPCNPEGFKAMKQLKKETSASSEQQFIHPCRDGSQPSAVQNMWRRISTVSTIWDSMAFRLLKTFMT